MSSSEVAIHGESQSCTNATVRSSHSQHRARQYAANADFEALSYGSVLMNCISMILSQLRQTVKAIRLITDPLIVTMMIYT